MAKKKRKLTAAEQKLLNRAWNDSRKARRDAHKERALDRAIEAMKPPKKPSE